MGDWPIVGLLVTAVLGVSAAGWWGWSLLLNAAISAGNSGLWGTFALLGVLTVATFLIGVSLTLFVAAFIFAMVLTD